MEIRMLLHGVVLVGLGLAIGVASTMGARTAARVLCGVAAVYAAALWLF
jgi:hypothetical protein